MYNTILVPLDGSKRAERILPHIEELVERYEAKLIFLGVVEPEPAIIVPDPFYTSLDPEMYQQRLKNVEHYLTRQAEKFQRKGIETEIRLGEGPIVDEIITTADNEEVDLIAMVSHGRTGLPRVFYGSVAAGILHRVDRPLLLIRSLDDTESK